MTKDYKGCASTRVDLAEVPMLLFIACFVPVPDPVLQTNDRNAETTTVFNESTETTTLIEAHAGAELVAQSPLELEPDENATFLRPDGADSWSIYSETTVWSFAIDAGDYVLE